MLLFFSTCQKKQTEVKISLNEKLNFNFSEYSEVFKNQFVSKDEYIIQSDSLITYYDTLKYFYSLRDYQPLFINSFEDNDKVFSLISILEKAGEHGLNPEQYHFSEIINEFTGATDTVLNLSRYYLLAMTELLMSDAILKYSYHLRYGVVNPKELFPDTYFLPVDDSSKGKLLEPLRQENLVQYFNDIQPKSKRYLDLQEALKYYSRFEELDWPSITLQTNKIEVGSRDALVPLIVEKLLVLEYLDTSKYKIKDPILYDSLIAEAIKSFQRDNGLNDDGVIGKNTIERLNTTPQQYVEKIKINLERFRWNNYTDSTNYILVNIPDFMLYIFENGEPVFKSKVCTGSKRPKYYESQMEVFKKTKRWSDKPDDWETPNLYGKISYMVLNPTWNVPQSIMREEIVYKMKKDSSYLSSHNFKVYLDTLELNPDSIRISDLSVEKIPYKIIQDPGAGNALGKIKFIFNNPHGIYLHDTPNRPPFKYDNRAVSHGCVRVENPIPLAEFLLRDHPKWNIDFLKIEIGLKTDNKGAIKEYSQKRESLRKYASLGKTTDVILPQLIQLYIDYFTAWVDKNGAINFRADVYDSDKVLLEYLNSKKLI
ncbi:MAG: L,D-transpeptidase family protein [Ignavibacteriaceae bacterium]